MTELYNVPRDTKVDLRHLGLRFVGGDEIKEAIFSHMDGMYGLLYVNGERINLASWTPVKIINN